MLSLSLHDALPISPNDLKLSDGGPEAGAVSTAAQGEGAGCAGASWRAAQPVTEPVGPKPPPLTGTDRTAVRCSAWLGVAVISDLQVLSWTWAIRAGEKIVEVKRCGEVAVVEKTGNCPEAACSRMVSGSRAVVIGARA